mmetsp:Transcript_39722/g.102300  ORF Transcript_39722/g.102300 Transcript_39722/m.102300 type:complete len:501 (-) Transcript_39722:569-2071(-)
MGNMGSMENMENVTNLKDQTIVRGYASCVSSADNDKARSSLIHSELWDFDPWKTNGPFRVQHVSYLSFSVIDAAFPSRTEEEDPQTEPLTHDHWIVLFAGTSKRDLLLQPPRSNRLIYVECVKDRACTCALRVVDGLQMKGVHRYWCEHNIGDGGRCIYVFALHQTGVLLTWTFDTQTDHFQPPVLVSQGCVSQTQTAEGDGQASLRVQYVKTQDAQTVVYYTRADQQHAHLWTSTLTFPAIDSKSSQTCKEPSPSKKRKLSPHKQRIEQIRSMVHALKWGFCGSRFDVFLFLLPELLQNAVAWKNLHAQSSSPYTQKVFRPFCEFLEVFDSVLSDTTHETISAPTGGLMSETAEQVWFENAVRFLQDVRFPYDLLKQRIQDNDDLGLSFVVWEHFHLGQNHPARKALVEWVDQTGVLPPKESDPDKADTDALDRESCTSFRLCMRLTRDLHHKYCEEGGHGPPWEQLRRVDPVVWQMVLGDRAYAHMRHFFQTAFLPAI